MGSKYTEAQKRATANYHKKNLSQIKIWVKKGVKDKLKKAAQMRNKSLTHYLVDLAIADAKLHNIDVLAINVEEVQEKTPDASEHHYSEGVEDLPST